MSKRREVVSFRVVPMSREPLTGIGVRLGEALRVGAPNFLIHECGYSPRGREDWNYPSLISPFWRLWHMSEEGCWIEWSGGRLEMTPQRIVVAPAHVLFGVHNRRAVAQLWLHFSLVPDYAFGAAAPFFLEVDDVLRAQLAALRAAHGAPRDERLRCLHHHASALLHQCFARRPLPLRALPDALCEVLRLIETSPESDLGNARLARLSAMSRGAFARWFSDYVGSAPATYVRRVRLDKASRLLAFSDLSIEQITAELGFANRQYFSRVFARHAGCGPAAFRKNYRAPRV